MCTVKPKLVLFSFSGKSRFPPKNLNSIVTWNLFGGSALEGGPVDDGGGGGEENEAGGHEERPHCGHLEPGG